MEQRRLRLGDILDDYCPRERRVTNHAVVAMIEEDVKQTRCTTCDAEHAYKGARVPKRRKKDTPAALYNEVLAGMSERRCARRAAAPTRRPGACRRCSISPARCHVAVAPPRRAPAQPEGRQPTRRCAATTIRETTSTTAAPRRRHRRRSAARGRCRRGPGRTAPDPGDASAPRGSKRRAPCPSSRFTIRPPATAARQRPGGGHESSRRTMRMRARWRRNGQGYGRAPERPCPGAGSWQPASAWRRPPMGRPGGRPVPPAGGPNESAAAAARASIARAEHASVAPRSLRSSSSLFSPQPHHLPVKFEPTTGVPTFAVREPVLRLKPGTTVESRTFSRPGDYYERAGGAWPGEVGPFYIEGATPNDTLVVQDRAVAAEPRHAPCRG